MNGQAVSRKRDYQTKSGDAVRRLLEEHKSSHLTAEEAHRLLTEGGVSIGLTTVYRRLEKLVSEGTARKISGDRQGSCYQLAGGDCQNHYHMICSLCGRMQHLDCEKTESLFSHIAETHGFTIDPSRTVLYGFCAACGREEKKGGLHA